MSTLVLRFGRFPQCFFSLVFMVLILTLPVFSQQELQKEYVQVVNVELIVRVLKNGSPVSGLKKNDFSLYVDGKKCEINGFFENRRRISRPEDQAENRQPPRLYLLFFWIGNAGADVEGVLDKFFSSIYREGDRVILSTPAKTFNLSSRQEIAGASVAFLEQWRQESRKGALRRMQFSRSLNRLLEDLCKKTLRTLKAEQKVNAFLMQYAAAIKEYQFQEFSPDMGGLEAMARSLLPIPFEKFALVFFQHGSLPYLDIATVTDTFAAQPDEVVPREVVDALRAGMSRIESRAHIFFNVHGFSEQLRSLFVQANAQFHLLFLSPDKEDGQIDVVSMMPATKSKEVYSNWDQVLRDISKHTGGLMLDGDRMVDAMAQVAAFEDIYYHITYAPSGRGGTSRKIDVLVNQPGMDVIHGRMLEMKELLQVKISAMDVSGRQLRLALADFYSFSREGIPTGLVSVQVAGRLDERQPLRLLHAQNIQTTGTVDLPLQFPQPGIWEIEARVVDQITGQEAVRKATANIAAAAFSPDPDAVPDPALAALLAQAAAYAEKLKKEAFHFTCMEEVTQEVFGLDEQSALRLASRTVWKYDYQITGLQGKVSESRMLLKKNGKKSHRENADLETRHRSLYAFYMPVTLLAKEKQHFYHYRLLDRKKNILHVAVARREAAAPIPWGEAWLNEDGAVIRIQIEQTSIVGIERLTESLKKRGFVPVISVIHEYDEVRGPIRFPSKTTFIERFNSGANPASRVDVPDHVYRFRNNSAQRILGAGLRLYSFERSRIYFEYKDYRFFSVGTSVAEKVE